MFIESALLGNKPRGKKLKDHEEFLAKKNLINETNLLNKQLAVSQNRLNELNEKIGIHFQKANKKETNLKNYIVDLNVKLYENKGVELDNKIENLHNEIINTIGDIQDKVRDQIEYTRKQMEKEVTYKFNEAELKQKDLMNQKIEQQKKVFDRMNYTKGELEKIIKKFEQTNNQCEEYIKENTNLKVQLEITKKSNLKLEEQLEKLKNTHKKIENDYNTILNESIKKEDRNDFLIESYENRKVNNFNSNPTFKLQLSSSQAIPPINDSINKTDQNQTQNYYSTLTKLREKVEKSKRNYNKIYREYIENQKKKTEAQQLIQKCIEDIQIQLNVANNKLKEQNNNMNTYTNNENINYKEMIKILERKLKILTFIYDNGIQNIKSKKTGLFYK
jgi:hypothetical protein